MTFVTARKFGDRILIVSDTMISDMQGGCDSLIPGALKSFVVNMNVSLALAGDYGVAIDVAREFYRRFSNSSDKEAMLTFLAAEVARRCEHVGGDSGKSCEFLLVTHISGPQMFKIWGRGQVTNGNSTELFLGDNSPAKFIYEAERKYPKTVVFDYISGEESAFCSAVSEMTQNPVEFRAFGVGGIMTMLLASPHGHTYQFSAGVCAWAGALQSKSRQDSRADGGDARYEYSICASFYRGASSLGVYFPQINSGYIYRPLLSDLGVLVSSIEQVDFARRIAELNEEEGGIIFV